MWCSSVPHVGRFQWHDASQMEPGIGTRRILLAAVLTMGVMTASCVADLAAPTLGPPTSRELSSQAVVYGHELTLHLASPLGPADPRAPLILYASGDGGWFGAAVRMYRTIADSGLNVVGFSAKAFLDNAQSRRGPVTAAHVVEGYQTIIDTALRTLRLPDDLPVVLTGWSRGASLAVVVAAHQPVDLRVRGVVAMGLAADEHLDVIGETDDDRVLGSGASATVAPVRSGAIDMYSLLSQIAPRRCAVIQASHDGYLPAARARALFGEDSDVKQLVAVDARNHRFDGGEAAFVEALRRSIRWVSMSGDSPGTEPSSQ